MVCIAASSSEFEGTYHVFDSCWTTCQCGKTHRQPHRAYNLMLVVFETPLGQHITSFFWKS